MKLNADKDFIGRQTIMSLDKVSIVATYGSENIDLSVAALRGPARGTDSAQRTARRARHDVGRGRDVPRTARAVRRGCGRIAPSILRPRGRHRDHLRGRQGVCGWGERVQRCRCVRSRRDRPRSARPHQNRAPRLTPSPTSIPTLRRPLRAGKTHPPREGYHPKKMIEGITRDTRLGIRVRRRHAVRARDAGAAIPATRALSLFLSLSLSPSPSASSAPRLPPSFPSLTLVLPSLTRPSPPSHPLPPQCLTATRREATPR